MWMQGRQDLVWRGARLGFLAAALVVASAAAGPAPAAGQGWIAPLPGGDGVVRLRTDVTVRVEGRVAEVEVEEWFENRGGGLGEGDYIYPLPGEAVFSNFSLYQGDEELRGETMNAERARAIYEAIVRSRRDPALIELVGHGLVRARVFPIEPGDTRRITLRYTQVLDRAGDALQFRYAAGGATPGAIGGPGIRPPGPRPPRPPMPLPHPVPQPEPQPTPQPAPQVEPSREMPNPRVVGDGAPLRFTLLADAAAFRTPFSPTHPLEVDRQGDRVRVRPVSELRGDFAVFLPLARGLVGVTLATHRSGPDDGYFMLTLSPGTVTGGAAPRDVTVVVDVSGSMSGQKMEQTRAALHQLLGSLDARDRFRLVAFSSDVRTSADGWARAEGAPLRDARRWVDDLRANGGTNIAGALDEAFRLESPADRLPIVVFMTDGLPTVGEQNPERIAAAAEARRGRARVFAFGVGYDVNTYLLDRLSMAGRGSTAYVQPGEDVEVALGGLAAKITHPVLTDLAIANAPVRLTEIHPVTLPDLFAGEELVVFGRYEGQGGGELRLTGRRADRTERFGITADFPRRSEGNDFIPRLWASRKLGELTRQVRLEGASESLIEEIRSTALRYGLLSEYTSHLVLEPGMVVAADGGNAVSVDGIVVTGQDGGVRTRGGAAAPAVQASGAAAVRAAESSRRMREVASADQLAAVEQEAAQALRSGGGADHRVVAGRTFRLEDGVWMEATRGETPRVVRIRAYGDAYFALLRAAPELRPIVAALEPVQVNGARVALRFGDDGETTLSAAAVDRLVAEFRTHRSGR